MNNIKKLGIIVTAYRQLNECKHIINTFNCQTSNDWEMIIVHDGPDIMNIGEQLLNEKYLNEKIKFICTDNHYGSTGAAVKNYALDNKLLENEWLLFAHCDCYYVPKFVEYMLNATNTNNTDIVYCDICHHHYDWKGVLKGKLEFSHVDIGSFIIKSKIAYNFRFSLTELAYDWQFIDEANKKYNIIKTSNYIPKVLYVCN